MNTLKGRSIAIAMGAAAAYPYYCLYSSSSSSSKWVKPAAAAAAASKLSLHARSHFVASSLPVPLKTRNPHHLLLRFHRPNPRATLDGKADQTATTTTTPLTLEVEESVKLLKNAAMTRRVAKEEVLSALSVIEKAKIDPSGFLHTLAGSETDTSGGRTWMLVFTAQKQLKGGRYFPLTAVQRFDAAAKRIENGVYLGPIGCLTFEGRISWKKRILAFIFETIRIKLGPLKPLEISLGQQNNKNTQPTTKDPFFIWFYVDEEIAVARGRGGGTAFWCRCRRVN